MIRLYPLFILAVTSSFVIFFSARHIFVMNHGACTYKYITKEHPHATIAVVVTCVRVYAFFGIGERWVLNIFNAMMQ